MDLVVARTPDGWTAHHGEAVVGQAVAVVRPDRRCFVAFRSCCPGAYRPLVQAIAEHLRRDLYTEIDDADAEVRDRLVGLGFVISRREHIYTIPTDPTVTGLSNVAVPAGLEVVTADRVDEDLLRELDDELKQDVPGADGWKWDRRGFRRRPTTRRTSIRPPIWWPSSGQAVATPGWSGSGTGRAARGSA
jgi:hypothetical protein